MNIIVNGQFFNIMAINIFKIKYKLFRCLFNILATSSSTPHHQTDQRKKNEKYYSYIEKYKYNLDS